jgi:predicted double-glycine peptidase
MPGPGRIEGCLIAASLLAAATPARAQPMFDIAGTTWRAPVTSLRDMPFRTVVRQQFDFSCGSAALATLLHYHYGRPVTEAEVFRAMYAAGDRAKIQRVGFSMLDMKNYLRAQGLEANGYRRSLADLREVGAPAIALIRVASYRHFVVVKGLRDGQVLVGDPAQGLKTYPEAEFARAWNGILFMIDSPPRREWAFNNSREWGALRPGPFEALDDSSLAAMTRDLPPLYQVSVGQVRGGGPP